MAAKHAQLAIYALTQRQLTLSPANPDPSVLLGLQLARLAQSGLTVTKSQWLQQFLVETDLTAMSQESITNRKQKIPTTHASQGTIVQVPRQRLVSRVPTNLSTGNPLSLIASRRQPVISLMQKLRQVSIKMCAPQACTAQQEQKVKWSLQSPVTAI